MANARTPRSVWIDAALDALADGGSAAIRVEALAATLGVSKGGFYWHFTNRQALVDEMLEAWETAGVDAVIARVETCSRDPRAKLQQLFEIASSRDGLGVEMALREWGRRDPDIAKRVRRADNRRIAYLRSLFGEFCTDENDVEVRSLLALSLFVGSYFIAADHGDSTRAEVLQLAVDRLLTDASVRGGP